MDFRVLGVSTINTNAMVVRVTERVEPLGRNQSAEKLQ